MRGVVFVLIIISIVLGSCKQQEKNDLSIGVMASMDFVPIAVAQKKGFFDKYKVNVEIQKFYSANDRDAAFQSKNIDGTVIDYTGAILQKVGGIDLKITSTCNSSFCILTGNPSINTIEDLKGKKLAVSRNTVIDFCMEAALKVAQVDIEEVKKQEINKIPIRLEMMMNEQIDATALPDPFITIAESRGARKIVCMDSLGYSTTGIIFNASVIEEKERQVQAFYQAYNEAVMYIQSTPLDSIKTILVQDVGFPEDLIMKVQLPSYTLATIPDKKNITTTMEWLKEKNLIPENFSTEGIIDDRFVSRQINN